MGFEERLIEEILASSGIVGTRRRGDVARELRAHLEDAIEEARTAGLGEVEIARLIARRFGGPEEIARQFADVYRAERRAIYFIAFFLLVVVALVAVSAFVGAVQVTVAIGMGHSAYWAFPSDHLPWEIAVLSGLTLGYMGLYFTAHLFKRRRLAKAILLTGSISTLAGLGLEAWWPGGGIAFIGAFCCSGAVRALETSRAGGWWKLAGLAAFFSTLGSLMPCVLMRAQSSSVWIMTTVFCLAIAVSCRFMTSLAATFDRRILRRNFV
jgi:hypothetical protein